MAAKTRSRPGALGTTSARVSATAVRVSTTAAHVVAVPITTLAIEKLGKALFANIVALGAITRVSGIVPLDAVKTAVANRVPPHTVDANMQALMVGYEAAGG